MSNLRVAKNYKFEFEWLFPVKCKKEIHETADCPCDFTSSFYSSVAHPKKELECVAKAGLKRLGFHHGGECMAESAKDIPGTDRSCEVISFVVLVILSALSHFWYLMIVFCITLALRGFVILVSRYMMASIHFVPWHAWKNNVPGVSIAERLPVFRWKEHR
jgi:hypothetical protein